MDDRKSLFKRAKGRKPISVTVTKLNVPLEKFPENAEHSTRTSHRQIYPAIPLFSIKTSISLNVVFRVFVYKTPPNH